MGYDVLYSRPPLGAWRSGASPYPIRPFFAGSRDASPSSRGGSLCPACPFVLADGRDCGVGAGRRPLPLPRSVDNTAKLSIPCSARTQRVVRAGVLHQGAQDTSEAVPREGPRAAYDRRRWCHRMHDVVFSIEDVHDPDARGTSRSDAWSARFSRLSSALLKSPGVTSVSRSCAASRLCIPTWSVLSLLISYCGHPRWRGACSLCSRCPSCAPWRSCRWRGLLPSSSARDRLP